MQDRMQNRTDAEEVPIAAGSSPRLYERVFDILSEQIAQGRFGTETALTETAIASRFGVSRAPARRALAELEQAGLIRRAKQRGFVVADEHVNAAARPGKASEGDEKLVSLPSWERIYRDVESEIIARISFATWRFNEAELARQYGVSRTVARDVIGRLQQSGLVQKDDRSRWFAPALTTQHVSELYELRWLLEPVALTKAASNLPDGLLAGMRSDLEAALAVGSDIEGERLDDFERDLHITLLGYCGNRALTQAITYPQSLLIAHRFLYRWTSVLFTQEPFLPEHLDVVEKLQAGQVEAAARSLEQHLKISRDRAISRIGVIAAGSQPDTVSYLERMTPAKK